MRNPGLKSETWATHIVERILLSRAYWPADADLPPVYVTRQIEFEPSSETSNDPSLATTIPTGRPHTLPSGSTKPVRKSSYSPVAFLFATGTAITSYPPRGSRFHEPCSAAKIQP